MPSEEENISDIDQLQEIYDYSLHLIRQKEDATDLLKGLINECDLQLKKVYLEQFNNSILVPQFYLIYGNVLREYAALQDDEAQNFLDMAKDQYELGLEKDDDGYKKDILVELILLNLTQSDETQAKNMIKENLKELNNTQRLKVGLGVQEYSNLFDDEEQRMEWNKFALDILQGFEILQEENLTRIDGIAQCYLSMANYYAEQASDDDVCLDTDKAMGFLTLGLEWIQKALVINPEYAHGLATMGEILIYMSDINAQLQISSESEKYYTQALDAFKKCHQLDSTVLPDQFFDLL